ncbi:MAG TPA: hypothetical protein P5202_03915 [Methanomassiliicoccales archaeon]|nr:hypothetical protein [Methanomassiliicoccales archaeon]
MVRRTYIAVALAFMMLAVSLTIPVTGDDTGDVRRFTSGTAGSAISDLQGSELVPSNISTRSAEGLLFNISVTFTYDLLDASESAPCAGAYVQLRMKGIGSFSTVRSGHTDANGTVAFYGLAAGTYLVRIETDDDRWVRVADGSQSTPPTFHWNTQQFTVSSQTDIEYRITDGTRGAWAVYSDLRDGGAWLDGLTGWERSQVTVVWPEGDWPHSHGDEIHLPADEDFAEAVWRRDIALHEYAHCVHYELRGGSFPEGNGPDPHYIDSESSPGFAFTEGWAQFFERAVDGDPERMDGSSLESTVFADGTYGHGDTGDMDGLIVEGAVASVLWDLYDGTNASDRPSGSTRGDFIDKEFSTLWNIMYDQQPESLEDIKRAWPVRDVNVTAVFRNSRVPMELDPPSNPTSFISSHEIGEGSGDSTISVIWSGASDRGSGVLGYSILISTDANGTPDLVMDSIAGSYTSPSLSPGTYYLHIRTVDQDGNWAEDVYTIGPFVIDEGAVPVNEPLIREGDLRQALFGLMIVLAIVVSLLMLVIFMDKKKPVPPPPMPVSYICRYCGRFDHGGEFCPYCGGRLR